MTNQSDLQRRKADRAKIHTYLIHTNQFEDNRIQQACQTVFCHILKSSDKTRIIDGDKLVCIFDCLFRMNIAGAISTQGVSGDERDAIFHRFGTIEDPLGIARLAWALSACVHVHLADLIDFFLHTFRHRWNIPMQLSKLFTVGLVFLGTSSANGMDERAALQAFEKATVFLQSISTRGGFVGLYSLDLRHRYGEGLGERAGSTQIWVQPPGTPSVGEVFLRAFQATGDRQYLKAARDVGRALAWGQRQQGGWDHCVDVANLNSNSIMPQRFSGACTFDDNISQGAVTFLMHLDGYLDEHWLDESIKLALGFMLAAQYENGAWPQWFPLRGGYRDFYTFNDGTINDCISVLLNAHRLYDEPVYLESARRAGDFIIESQLPAPQAGWAQQYSHDLRPAWARRFEPPGVCSEVTARNIRTLADLYRYSNDEKYTRPIPMAVDWLNRSVLPDHAISDEEVEQSEGGAKRQVGGTANVWARLYEVKTNKPVYGDRENPWKLIYDIEELSRKERDSYGWQGFFGIPEAIDYVRGITGEKRPQKVSQQTNLQELEAQISNLISEQDNKGRWITDDMLRIETFVVNMNLICDYLDAASMEASRQE